VSLKYGVRPRTKSSSKHAAHHRVVAGALLLCAITFRHTRSVNKSRRSTLVIADNAHAYRSATSPMPLRFTSFQKFFGGAGQPQVFEILCSKSVEVTL
jgi:hypothetical protein